MAGTAFLTFPIYRKSYCLSASARTCSAFPSLNQKTVPRVQRHSSHSPPATRRRQSALTPGRCGHASWWAGRRALGSPRHLHLTAPVFAVMWPRRTMEVCGCRTIRLRRHGSQPVGQALEPTCFQTRLQSPCSPLSPQWVRKAAEDTAPPRPLCHAAVRV